MRASPRNQQANELDKIRAMSIAIHPDNLIDDDVSDSDVPTNHNWITGANAWLERANKEMQVALVQAERNLEKLEQMRLEVRQMHLEVIKLSKTANTIETESKARETAKRQHKTKRGFMSDVWMLRKAKYGMSYS